MDFSGNLFHYENHLLRFLVCLFFVAVVVLFSNKSTTTTDGPAVKSTEITGIKVPIYTENK